MTKSTLATLCTITRDAHLHFSKSAKVPNFPLLFARYRFFPVHHFLAAADDVLRNDFADSSAGDFRTAPNKEKLQFRRK